MKKLARLVLICFLPALSVKAQTDSTANKPLQVFASVGENALNLDPLNNVISNTVLIISDPIPIRLAQVFNEKFSKTTYSMLKFI